MPAPTLVATPGDASANSYADLTEANTYNASRPFVDAWAAASDNDKTAALEQAARILDASFDWTGSATLDAQALCWPRIGMFSRNKRSIDSMTIPQALKDAQSEFARQLLADDRSSDNDAVKNDVLLVKASGVAVSFRNTEAGATPEMRDADVRRKGPDFDYLSKAIPDAVRNLLVSTWYRQHLVTPPMVFMASGGGGHHRG